MYNAIVSYKDKTAVMELPLETHELRYQLMQLGIRDRPENICIVDDDEEQDVHVKLYSGSDFENATTVLFTQENSLAQANRCAHLLKNALEDIREELEQNLLYGQYSSPQELMTAINEMTESLVGVTVNYYCPLTIQITDPEEGEQFSAGNEYAVMNEYEIRERLQFEQEDDLNDMASYFDGSESAKAKLISAIWDVENVDGEVFGVIHTKLRCAFTPAEEKEWIEELIGQAADGFGEGFEQREIKTRDDEDMYVSFWNSGDDYFMENETDFTARMNGQKFKEMEMN